MSKYLPGLLILCSTPCFAASPYTVDLAAGLISDDNITNGRDAKDIEDDTIVGADAGVSYHHPLDDHSAITNRLDFALQQYQDFDKLSNSDLKLSIEYRFQPDLHFTAPWYFVSLSLGQQAYDSTFRDNSYYQLGVGLGKRFTDTISIMAGFSMHSSSAENSLFDVDSNRLYINADLKTAMHNTTYVTLQLISGDIISTNVPPHPAVLNNISWVDDDAYPSLSNPWTYRLDADTTAIQLGNHFAFDSHQAIDVSISRYDSDAYGNFNYERTIISAHYLYRF
jgi:hypothetical protein